MCIVCPKFWNLRATACTRCLSEAESKAEAEAGGKDVSVAGIVHQNSIVDLLEYEG